MFQYSLWKHPDTLPGQQNKQKAQVEPLNLPCLVWQEPSWPGVSKGGDSEAGGPPTVADTFNHSKDWGFHPGTLGTKEMKLLFSDKNLAPHLRLSSLYYGPPGGGQCKLTGHCPHAPKPTISPAEQEFCWEEAWVPGGLWPLQYLQPSVSRGLLKDINMPTWEWWTASVCSSQKPGLQQT